MPTVQKLHSKLFTTQKIQVEILRMDLLHPIISGNKYLKLLPWLQQAKAQGKTHIVTKGGPWSNHVHAAAYACKQQGFCFTAIIKAKQGTGTTTLHDVRQWDGQIIYCNHEEYKDENIWQLWARQNNAFYVPMGGEGAEGVSGVTTFFNGLKLADYDYVICPVGTGTTYNGIALSTLQYKHLIGINPGIKDDEYAHLLAMLRQETPGSVFEIIANMDLKKFGKWPADLPAKMNEWYSRWKLPTDIVYTAKMMWVFQDLVGEGYFGMNSRILLIHTGGLQGNRSLVKDLLFF